MSTPYLPLIYSSPIYSLSTPYLPPLSTPYIPPIYPLSTNVSRHAINRHFEPLFNEINGIL